MVDKGMPREGALIEFARRLQAKLTDRGWLQADLVRAANKHMPGRKKIGRDSVSKYLRALNQPSPVYLAAISRALGCKPEDLLDAAAVRRGLPSAQEGPAPFKMSGLEDGNVWVSLSMALPWDAAIKIMQITKGPPEEPKH